MLATTPRGRPANVFARLAARFDPTSLHASSMRERDEALADVRAFARHVRIQDAVGQEVAFARVGWAWQFALLALWALCRLTVTLKARQLGVSWLAAMFALFTAMRAPGQAVLLISKRQEDADKLLEKVAYIYERLPDWKPRAVVNTRSIRFPGLGSEIEAMPASEGVGRSRTANLVVLDEHAHQPFARKILQAVMAAAEHGKILSISTGNGRGALHSGLFLGAKGRRKLLPAQLPDGTPLPICVTADVGPNGWRGVFIPFSARPGRDDAWRARARTEQSELTDAEFVQEYPRDDVEAISSTGRVVFRPEDIERQPIERGTDDHGIAGLIVYRAPAPGRSYVLGADVGEGLETSDWSSACVLDSGTGEQVAQIRGRWSTDTFAQRIADTAARYGMHASASDPTPVLVAVERNNHGLAVIQDLIRIRPASAPWRQVRMVGSGAHRRSGWLTTNANRPVLVRQLEIALRTDAITLHDSGTLDQFATFAYNGDGRPEAQEGSHDDDVMAVGIAQQVRMRPGAVVLDVPPSARRAA